MTASASQVDDQEIDLLLGTVFQSEHGLLGPSWSQEPSWKVHLEADQREIATYGYVLPKMSTRRNDARQQEAVLRMIAAEEGPWAMASTGMGLRTGDVQTTVASLRLGIELQGAMTARYVDEAVNAGKRGVLEVRDGVPNAGAVDPVVTSADQNVVLFSNKFPNDLIGDPKVVPNDRLSGISGNFNYVVTEDGSLIVGRSGHTSLTGGADVQAAGEVQLYNGNIKWLDNSSGHYQPFGPTLQPTAEDAFNNIGLNATGKFNYRTW